MVGWDHSEAMNSGQKNTASPKKPKLKTIKKDVRTRKYNCDRQRFRSVEGENQSRIPQYFSVLNSVEMLI